MLDKLFGKLADEMLAEKAAEMIAEEMKQNFDRYTLMRLLNKQLGEMGDYEKSKSEYLQEFDDFHHKSIMREAGKMGENVVEALKQNEEVRRKTMAAFKRKMSEFIDKVDPEFVSVKPD